MNTQQSALPETKPIDEPADAKPIRTVNDVTGLNPVSVWGVATPTSVEELQKIVRNTRGSLSIGGGHFSMGGQTASEGSLHLDMRHFNRVLNFNPIEKQIVVESGVRWCDIQRFIDPHGLAVKIMQTYANFTVGGSLSVNVHGRYVGLGPLVLSVEEIQLLLADGALIVASRTQHAELFHSVIGGYGGFGIIVQATLSLADNVRLERISKKLDTANYLDHFRSVQNQPRKAVLHNADLYPPHFRKLRSVSWYETDRPATTVDRLQKVARRHWLEKYFYWSFTESLFGNWRREHIVDPLLYLKRKVHWRNYEAGYDVAELEPVSRESRTYVLQEYFVPVDKFDDFVERMGEILNRHKVNVINVSVRHASADTETLMSWAPVETFAFVLYYKQRTRENARARVAVWTRELIDAALACDGSYYLPYQAHATDDQFHRAYPRALKAFDLKATVDPTFRFRNVIWDRYYGSPDTMTKPRQISTSSEFHQVFGYTGSRDDFYRFLQVVFRLQPEDRMHQLIREACERHPLSQDPSVNPDEAIYRDVQQKVGKIRPWHSVFSYALPALATQKKEMTRQTLQLLGARQKLDGYVEIGSTGRYASSLAKKISITGPVYFVADEPPSNAPVDIAERGGLRKLGTYLPLDDYAPLDDAIEDESVDFVSCLIGLHHVPPAKLESFLASIARVLRPGGVFVLRDHDVSTPAMDKFVALVHTVFNCGTDVSWDENAAERRHFASVPTWIERIEKQGLVDEGNRLLQANDPSANTLLSFVKMP